LDDHGNGHSSQHGEHGVHLPDPSAWPLVAGFAALALGAALIWWARDPDSRLTGPLLGAAIVIALISVAGWAYEDGRMRRKAEEPGRETGPARYTQVVTFAIAEDQFDQARSRSGVLQTIDRSDSALRDLAGFQDLRIVASPTTIGPAQVLVETTWSGRDELATYEETRRTILDILNQHPEEVVPGSVQVFDMEVVRDTKEVAFRFSLGAAASLIGALLVGGFMVGVGLSLFQEDRVVAGPPVDNGPGEPATGTVIATDNRFNFTTLEAPPNTQVTFTLINQGRAPHNLAFYTNSSATQELAPGSIGEIIRFQQTDQITFTTPGPGTYFFHCDLHPVEMRGTFVVREGAPVPGE
jgi:plastocyanin